MKNRIATLIRVLVVSTVAVLIVNVPVQAGRFFAKPASVNKFLITDCQEQGMLCWLDNDCCSKHCDTTGGDIGTCDD